MARGTMAEDIRAQDKATDPANAGWHRGTRCPPRPSWSELLHVGRNSVREALKALQAMSIVEIRHGFGTFVGPLTLEPFVEGVAFRAAVRHHQGEPSLYELMKVREALETGPDRRRRRASPRRGSRRPQGPGAADGGGGRAAAGSQSATDRAFHLALYRSMGNHLLSEVLDAFWAALRRVREDLSDDRQDPEVTHRQHQEIVDALDAARRRPRGARR